MDKQELVSSLIAQEETTEQPAADNYDPQLIPISPTQPEEPQLFSLAELQEEKIVINNNATKNSTITNLIQINKSDNQELQTQVLQRMDKINKLLYMISVGIGVITLVTSAIMVNSYITNKRLARIEKIISESEIQTKDTYTTDEKIEFTLNIKDELNKIMYIDEGVKDVYAADHSLYLNGDIKVTPHIVNTTHNIELKLPLDITKQSDTSFVFSNNNPQDVLVPGQYQIQFELSKGAASGIIAQDFTWGVLAINTNKSIYTPNQIAKLYLAVLDENGEMACNADINLEIVNPAGKTTSLSTGDGSIIVNESCEVKDVVRKSDFEAKYYVEELGTYEMNLSATTKNGTHSIKDTFQVTDYVSMDIERITATRIYPQEDYPVIFKITTNEDFGGTINEYMDKNYKPIEPTQEVLELFTEKSDIKYDFYDSTTILKNGRRRLTWDVEWQAGETHYLAYGYDAPDISPDFYTLGPLSAEATILGNNFKEVRKWQIAVDAVSAFRVTEYYLTTGDFTGTTYDLTLDNDLADDYFVLVRGSKDGNGGDNADSDYVRVFEVPNATGELADSGALNVISLSRFVADNDWEGVVTVVESVADSTQAGFTLLDIVETPITASSTSGTDTSGTAWTDINDVTLFGGFHGGGAEFESAAGATDGNAVQTRLYPSSTSTLNWTRESTTALNAVTMTTFVVEWGSEWTVQRVNLSGSANGNGCNATGEYGTGTISSVTRANTWVWATGISNGNGIGDSMSGTIVTLGDGVNQNASETSVAYCGEYNHTKDIDVYTMTHSSLAVDYRFKADGDGASTDLAVTVDSATDGYRFAWITNGTNGSGSAHPRDRFWARYTANTEVTASHGYTGQDWPAWIQGIDFNAVAANVPVTVQNHFRWRDDTTDINTTGGWIAAEDTNVSDVLIGDTYRLRLEVANGGGAVETASKTYELEWGELGVNPTCGTVSTWTGVADLSDEIDMVATTHITPDGEATSALLANSESYTFTAGEGRETADTTGTIGPMSALYYTELEFSIKPTATTSAGATYCFKVTDAGTDIDLYNEYPSITMKSDKVVIGEVGQTTTDYQGTTVSFNNKYENPIVIAESITTSDIVPAAAMITAIDGTGFTVRIQETDVEADNHGNETVSWMVMEQGAWTLDNGILVDAGVASLASTNYWNGGTVYDCNFTQTFSSAPAIFTALQTNNNTGAVDFLNSAAFNGTTSDFDCYIHIEDGGSGAPTTGEDFGWIAFDQGTGTNDGITYEFGQTPDSVLKGYAETWYDLNYTQTFSSAPIFMSTRKSGNGSDEGWMRYSNNTSVDVDLYIDENDDSDRSHGTADSAYFAAFDSTGDLTARISYDQAAYRWFQNSDSLDVGTTRAAQDTAVNLDTNTDIARLRMLIDIGVQKLRRYGQDFKLQYAEKSGTCDTSFTGETYADITTTTPIAYYNNATPSDGGTLVDNINDPNDGGDTVINQTYEEANDFTNDISAVAITEDAMWDFSLYDYNAGADVNYCIRAVQTDGTTFGTYSIIPEITTVGINISGTAYTDDDEVTPLSGVDVCTAVDATFDVSDCATTDGSGVFDIINVPAVGGGEQLSLFVDGATNGNVISKANTTDITNVVLYENHILTRYETGDTLTIIDMDAYDNDQNAADMLFDAENAAPDTLTWETATELYIPANYTFTPGGNLDGHDIEIDGTWDATTTETINTDGTFKLDIGGTFNEANTTLTFDGTAGIEDLITDGSGDLYNLVVDDGGGSLVVEVEDALTVLNDVTITNGELDVKTENNQINVGGSWTNNDIFDSHSGTVVFDGATTATLDSGCLNSATCPNQNFYNLTIDKSENSPVTLINTELRVANLLKIIEGIFNQGANDADYFGSTALEVNDFGRYRNLSTGNITLGGDVINDGEITLNGNGTTCDQADSIILTSTDTSQRNWSGVGANRITDTTVSYMTASSKIVTGSSTNAGNNGSNWLFAPCQTFNFEGLNIENIEID